MNEVDVKEIIEAIENRIGFNRILMEKEAVLESETFTFCQFPAMQKIERNLLAFKSARSLLYVPARDFLKSLIRYLLADEKVRFDENKAADIIAAKTLMDDLSRFFEALTEQQAIITAERQADETVINDIKEIKKLVSKIAKEIGSTKK